MDRAPRRQDLEKENARLRRVVSDLTLDKLILQRAGRGRLSVLQGGVVLSISSGD